MGEPVRVTARECKANITELFRRAAAGETIIVTRNGAPQVEIRRAPADGDSIAEAVRSLNDLHRTQLAERLGGGHKELRRIQACGRD